MNFELTNNDRRYLGIKLIETHWEKFQLSEEIVIYFDGSKIVKSIGIDEDSYEESDMNEETSENRTILLPKTKKGKPKKLNFSSFNSRNGIGTYFSFTAGEEGVIIGNYTNQRTFYDTYFEGIVIEDFVELRKWLDNFINSSPKNHLKDIQDFGTKKRKLVHIKEGDFFTFKVDRFNYGFGRILLDVRKLKKNKAFKDKKNYGLLNLMSQPLTIKVYHKKNTSKDINLKELKKCKSIPSQHIMDNRFLYGDYEIIGNIPLEKEELDFPISFSQSISQKDLETIYFQWGYIYKEKHPKQISDDLTGNYFRNEGVGFDLDLKKSLLDNCINNDSNNYYWNSNEFQTIKEDLRNPKNKEYKNKIFKEFGLNPQFEYYENALQHGV